MVVVLWEQFDERCRFLLHFEEEVRETLEGVQASDHPFRGQDVNASDLRWALSAVSTRAFRLHGNRKVVQGGSSDHVPMMLPLIDMCNHSFSPNVRIIQEQDGSDSNTLVKVLCLRSLFLLSVLILFISLFLCESGCCRDSS